MQDGFRRRRASNTSALAFGGNLPGNTAVTELWNGTSWSEQNDMSTARREIAGAGNATAALGFGGYAGAASADSEEWLGAGSPAIRTISTD
jgi:hypothetical protein